MLFDLASASAGPPQCKHYSCRWHLRALWPSRGWAINGRHTVYPGRLALRDL